MAGKLYIDGVACVPTIYDGNIVVRRLNTDLYDIVSIEKGDKPNRLNFLMLSKDEYEMVIQVCMTVDDANKILTRFKDALSFGILSSKDNEVFANEFRIVYSDLIEECLEVYIPVRDLT